MTYATNIIRIRMDECERRYVVETRICEAKSGTVRDREDIISNIRLTDSQRRIVATGWYDGELPRNNR